MLDPIAYSSGALDDAKVSDDSPVTQDSIKLDVVGRDSAPPKFTSGTVCAIRRPMLRQTNRPSGTKFAVLGRGSRARDRLI